MFGKTFAFAGTLLVAAALIFVTPASAQPPPVGYSGYYRGNGNSFPSSQRGYRYYGSVRYYSPNSSYYPSYSNYAYPGSYYPSYSNYTYPGYYNDTYRGYTYASPRYRYSYAGSGPYIYYR
jgi:hypothetical protein